MLARLLFSILLAIASLWCTAAASVLEKLHKRYPCAQYMPGALRLGASAGPFRTCNAAPDVVSFSFQEDANFVVYNGSWTPVWYTSTGGRSCSNNNCTLIFQTDGNFVLYYNRAPIWYSGTGGGIGKALWMQNVPPYMYILNSAGAQVWQT